MNLRIIVVPLMSFVLALGGAFVGYKLARPEVTKADAQPPAPSTGPAKAVAPARVTPPPQVAAVRKPEPHDYEIVVELTPLLDPGIRLPQGAVAYVNADGVSVREPALISNQGKSTLTYTGYRIVARFVARNYTEAKITLFRDGREVARDSQSGDLIVLTVSDP
jgi:hypothetical protein